LKNFWLWLDIIGTGGAIGMAAVLAYIVLQGQILGHDRTMLLLNVYNEQLLESILGPAWVVMATISLFHRLK